jgi:putative ABC transport system substrate-binding protein
VKRREFIAGLGSIANWPTVAQGQQGDRIRRIGVLTPYREDDPFTRPLLSTFVQRLAELGWSEDRNLRMDVRWVAGDLDRVRMYAKELVDLQPDVILVDSTTQTAALQRETRTIPIVFVTVSDPVGSGFVASLPQPGGNITGFTNQDPTLGGKWVELLTEIAPDRRRVAAMFNPETAPNIRSYYLPSFEAAARLLKVEPIVVPVHSDADIETALTSLGRGSGAVVLMPDVSLVAPRLRASILSLTVRNKIPAIYQSSGYVREGLLISYGPGIVNFYRQAAGYVEVILRGAKPSELPVQLPVKFEMAVNLMTAKALGITVPPSLLARADEIIE